MVLRDRFDDYLARELYIIFGILGSQRDGLFVDSRATLEGRRVTG